MDFVHYNSVTTDKEKRKGQADRKLDGQNCNQQKHISETHKTDELVWPDCIGSPEVLDQFGLKSRNPL